MNHVEAKNLSHSFIRDGNSIEVIDNFSLNAGPGEVIALLGPSGCGKSTILRCIAGLLEPVSGNVLLNGKRPQVALKEKQIGFAFQESALLDWLTVKENICLPGVLGRKKNDLNEIDEKSNRLLAVMGLTSFKHFFPSQLSGGMRQRAALARALLIHPSILLLDEPFGSLDLLTRMNLIIELASLLSKATFPTILVTHSVEEAVYLANKVYILSPRPARVIKEMTFDFTNPKNSALFEQIEFLRGVSDCRNILLRFWENYEDKNKS